MLKTLCEWDSRRDNDVIMSNFGTRRNQVKLILIYFDNPWQGLSKNITLVDFGQVFQMLQPGPRSKQYFLKHSHVMQQQQWKFNFQLCTLSVITPQYLMSILIMQLKAIDLKSSKICSESSQINQLCFRSFMTESNRLWSVSKWSNK